ncbi:MAG: arginase family protein [Hyphomicrobiales bacterium]
MANEPDNQTKPEPDLATMFGAGGADTFLGLPLCLDVTGFDQQIAVIGAPCATPYPSVGAYCAGAPSALRASMSGYADLSHHMDFDLGGEIFPNGKVCAMDCGDIPYDEKDPRANRKRIRDTVCHILDRGGVPLVLGGDDSIPIPVIQAFEGRGDLTILQVDAHIDWREDVDGVQMGLSSTMRRSSETPHVTTIVQAGARAIGSARPSDYQDALAWGASFVTAREVHEHGISQIVDHIPAGNAVYIAIDVDALDPNIIPGVIGPAPGGLTYWHIVSLISAVAAKTPIAGASLVEFVPNRDINGIGALTTGRLAVNLLGHLARQLNA